MEKMLPGSDAVRVRTQTAPHHMGWALHWLRQVLGKEMLVKTLYREPVRQEDDWLEKIKRKCQVS